MRAHAPLRPTNRRLGRSANIEATHCPTLLTARLGGAKFGIPITQPPCENDRSHLVCSASNGPPHWRTHLSVSVVVCIKRLVLSAVCRCDTTVQGTVKELTFEELIIAPQGVTASRALVNVVINQQIGQQISVSGTTRCLFTFMIKLVSLRLTPSVRYYNSAVGVILQHRRRSVVQGNCNMRFCNVQNHKN